ncbi:Ger(x)C family spore germination protein [Metabacillus sp. Hm71]|uniref:Ger(x)C family spore germination protein n=1 Tax=Metabacillus sp. Hm71 TaxID=3450743 RepID=UPI003F41F9EF
MKTISFKAVKRMLTISVCSFTLFLTGCWDRVELNDLALVMAAGLDITDDDMIELTVQLAVPQAMGGGQGMGSGQGGGGNPTTVEKATGNTIFDAVSRLQEQVSRRIFWGHNRVIIFGEKLAEEGIQKHIDFFARHSDPRLRAFTFVTDGKAADALKVIPDLEKSSAEIARELAKFKVGMSVTVKDLLQGLSGEAGATALPWIEAEETGGKGGLRMNGTAVFKKDKMAGRIDDRVTRGVLWLRDEIELASVTVEPKDADGQISFSLLRSRTKLIPKINNGKWKMIVKIVTEDDAVENETKLNLMNPKIAQKLEKQLEQDIDKRIRMTLDQVQKEMETDIFGFAEVFHHHYPKQWSKVKHQWDEKFPEIEVEIKTKAYIRRPGMSTSPQGVPEKEVKGK